MYTEFCNGSYDVVPFGKINIMQLSNTHDIRSLLPFDYHTHILDCNFTPEWALVVVWVVRDHESGATKRDVISGFVCDYLYPGGQKCYLFFMYYNLDEVLNPISGEYITAGVFAPHNGSPILFVEIETCARSILRPIGTNYFARNMMQLQSHQKMLWNIFKWSKGDVFDFCLRSHPFLSAKI